MNRHIVVVGAGFTGLGVIQRLQHLLPEADITVIDKRDHFLFTPRLIDLLADPSGGTAGIKIDLHTLAQAHRWTFKQGTVTHIDQDANKLTYIQSGSIETTQTINFDALVLAHGTKPCFFNVVGAMQYALPVKSLEDATRIHTHIESCLRQAIRITDVETQNNILTFCAVGAGPSGVEALCAIKRFTERRCREFASELLDKLSWHLFQAGPQILPGFNHKLVQRCLCLLEKQRINIHTNSQVTGVAPDHLDTIRGSYATSTVLWTAGIEANSIESHPPLHTDRGGYLPVDSCLRLSETISAGGDVVIYKEENLTIPRNAQTAMLMSDIIAHNIVTPANPRHLHYKSKGNIILLGRSGVIEAKPFIFTTRFTALIRHLFYRFRFWQLTRM